MNWRSAAWIPARSRPPPQTSFRSNLPLPHSPSPRPRRFTWNAAWEKYHENIWKFNYAYDRDLRYSAVSKNMLLEHLHHTKPKSLADHVSKMVSTNKKVYDAFNADSKRVLIWQVQPALQ